MQRLADVLAALRSKPGSVTFGHNGAGTNGHLAIRMLASAAKVEPNEISYRGTAVQRTDLLGGHLDVGMVSVSEVPELHGGNKGPLRAIAVLAKQRSPSLPDVPTAEELGIPVTMTAERGFAVAEGCAGRDRQEARSRHRGRPARSGIHQGLARRCRRLSFMPGAEWQKRLDEMNKALQPFAEEMKAQEQK